MNFADLRWLLGMKLNLQLFQDNSGHFIMIMKCIIWFIISQYLISNEEQGEFRNLNLQQQNQVLYFYEKLSTSESIKHLNIEQALQEKLSLNKVKKKISKSLKQLKFLQKNSDIYDCQVEIENNLFCILLQLDQINNTIFEDDHLQIYKQEEEEEQLKIKPNNCFVQKNSDSKVIDDKYQLKMNPEKCQVHENSDSKVIDNDQLKIQQVKCEVLETPYPNPIGENLEKKTDASLD